MTKKKKVKDVSKGMEGREAVFHPEFREDLHYWVKTDRKVALRVFELIEGIIIKLAWLLKTHFDDFVKIV